MYNDTICAIATPYGTGGISVIRVSGNSAIKEFNKLFPNKDLRKVKSHTIHYGKVFSVDKKNQLDEVLVAIYKKPKSFTGEDTVEIFTHGGILVTQSVLEELLKLNIRLANPGEFSKRAYLNKKIDLVQAESIMDLISAKNKNALKIANLGLTKKTSNLITDLRNDLLKIISEIEVKIDYPEYDEIKDYTKETITPKINKLISKMNKIVKESQKTNLIKEGINTIIVGKPNVGKSSLLNHLIGEDKAIVTNIAGTTRDLVEASINLKGITLNLIDTAGIRTTKDKVEKIGVERTKKALKKADLVLLLLDLSKKPSKEDLELLKLTKAKPRIIIGNKLDLKKNNYYKDIKDILEISVKSNKGLDKLENKILEILNLSNIKDSDLYYLSNIRQINYVKNSLYKLKETKRNIDKNIPIDLVLIDIRDAFFELGNILGTNYNEEIIDNMFSQFCLGK